MPIPDAASPAAPDAPAPGTAPAPAAAADPRGPERFEPIAGIFAIILPGAGHFVLGERRRALLIAAGVLGLFLGGVLIGGIDAIDRKEDPIWFAGQALVGPVAFGVDYCHQTFFKIRTQERVIRGRVRYDTRSARPDEARDPTSGQAAVRGPGIRPPNSKSLGRMNELGTLFATIAGMLNLIVIIDAFFHAKGPVPMGASA